MAFSILKIRKWQGEGYKDVDQLNPLPITESRVVRLQGIGSDSITASSTIQKLDLTKAKGIPTHALMTVETANIRFIVGKGTLSTTVGIQVAAGASIDLTNLLGDYQDYLTNFRFIAVSGSPVLQVQYFNAALFNIDMDGGVP